MRTSCFVRPDNEVSTVLLDSDVTDTLESAYYRVVIPGALTVAEIFEMDDGTGIEEATLTAMQRKANRSELEHHMALSYFWNADVLRTVTEGGLLFNDRPAPIPADEYRPVLEQLAKHPNYRHQAIMVVTSDGKTLKMQDGQVKEEA